MSDGDIRRIVISGARGSGKTTEASRLVEEFRDRGLRVGGVLSLHEHPGDPEREGYRFRFLTTGEELPYARRSPEPTPPSRRFRFDPAAFERARAELEAARGTVVVIDECGPLEARGEGLWVPLARLWREPARTVVITVRASLIERFLVRLGPAPVEPRIVRLP